MGQKINKIVIVCIIVLMLSIALLVWHISNAQFIEQRNAYIKDVEAILLDYGISIDSISFSAEDKCYATIDVAKNGVSYRDIYYALKTISDYEYELPFYSIIFFDHFNYYETTLYNGWPALEYRGTILWTEKAGNLEDLYKNDIPFEGMDDYYISKTILGDYDSMELCRDFEFLDRDHQSVTYYWYDTEGNVVFIVHTLAGEVISVTDNRS